MQPISPSRVNNIIKENTHTKYRSSDASAFKHTLGQNRGRRIYSLITNLTVDIENHG